MVKNVANFFFAVVVEKLSWLLSQASSKKHFDARTIQDMLYFFAVIDESERQNL